KGGDWFVNKAIEMNREPSDSGIVKVGGTDRRCGCRRICEETAAVNLANRERCPGEINRDLIARVQRHGEWCRIGQMQNIIAAGRGVAVRGRARLRQLEQ